MRSIFTVIVAILASLSFVTPSPAAEVTSNQVAANIDHADGDQPGRLKIDIDAYRQADLAIRAKQSGFQTLIHIRGPQAPTRYEFDIPVPLGGKLNLAKDGGVEVLDAFGLTVGYLQPPWAKDARGVAVPTRYLVEGNRVIQTVNHHGAVYPVVADPWIIPAIWVYKIIRCGGGAALGYISSAGWRWYERAVSVTFGCILAV